MDDGDTAERYHIIGIGGIGMSAIAEVMHARGMSVQGSDQNDSANTQRLRAMGIRCLLAMPTRILTGQRM